MARPLAKAICKISTTFDQENHTQPPLKDPSQSPTIGDDPACRLVKIKVDASLCDGDDCSKTFSYGGPIPNIDPPKPGREHSEPEPSYSDPNKTYDMSCKMEGRTLVRIVGGKDACPNELPYHVRLQTPANSGTFCGGSVINENYVLTAAHCMTFRYHCPGSIQAVAADRNRLIAENTEQNRDFVAVKTNKSYVGVVPTENGLAILKKSPPFECNANVQAVLIPPRNSDAKENGLVLGWGYLNTTTQIQPEIRQKVTLLIITDEECQKAYSEDQLHANTSICVVALEEGMQDSCAGDSGSPLAQRFRKGSYINVRVFIGNIPTCVTT